MAPAKLVGKLLNLFDSTAHRVVGGLPPSVPSTSHSSAQCNEHDRQKVGPRVSNSQSTMAMSSLMPSASTESEWKGGNNRSMHNRSISEPDFGRTPRKVNILFLVFADRISLAYLNKLLVCFQMNRIAIIVVVFCFS